MNLQYIFGSVIVVPSWFSVEYPRTAVQVQSSQSWLHDSNLFNDPGSAEFIPQSPHHKHTTKAHRRTRKQQNTLNRKLYKARCISPDIIFQVTQFGPGTRTECKIPDLWSRRPEGSESVKEQQMHSPFRVVSKKSLKSSTYGKEREVHNHK